MGLTHITATVQPIDRSGKPIQAKFLVDSGAIDCLLPASLLRQAGVEPQEICAYELASGQVVEYPVGPARIDFMDTTALCKVIFGPEDAEPILGVIALEYAGITIDPTTQRLKRLAVRSLKKAA